MLPDSSGMHRLCPFDLEYGCSKRPESQPLQHSPPILPRPQVLGHNSATLHLAVPLLPSRLTPLLKACPQLQTLNTLLPCHQAGLTNCDLPQSCWGEGKLVPLPLKTPPCYLHPPIQGSNIQVLGNEHLVNGLVCFLVCLYFAFHLDVGVMLTLPGSCVFYYNLE